MPKIQSKEDRGQELTTKALGIASKPYVDMVKLWWKMFKKLAGTKGLKAGGPPDTSGMTMMERQKADQDYTNDIIKKFNEGNL